MNFRVRVQRFQFSFVNGKILVAEITDVDRLGAILRELVGGRAADAEGRVCSCDYGNAGLEAPVIMS